MHLRRSKSASVLAPLLGAALLAGLALRAVPWREGMRRPRTLLDLSSARDLAPGADLLNEAARVIPGGASFVVRTEPPNAVVETWYHRISVGLLPGRQSLPASLLGRFADPQDWRRAQYLVLIGPPPHDPPGELLLDTPNGTVWRRKKS
ncbi:MAG TPA: hypothetical protein VGG65_07310 [Thermoanaerobaculia bacterium]